MTDYDILIGQMDALLDGTDWVISALSNASALIMDSMHGLNWAGFYVFRDGRLQLGPFQGRPACVSIEMGRGVCGTAAAEEKTQLVYDVHKFPGHIACDSASNSEIVIPIKLNGILWGVLDIDSPVTGRFTEEDRIGLERVAGVIEKRLKYYCGGTGNNA